MGGACNHEPRTPQNTCDGIRSYRHYPVMSHYRIEQNVSDHGQSLKRSSAQHFRISERSTTTGARSFLSVATCAAT